MSYDFNLNIIEFYSKKMHSSFASANIYYPHDVRESTFRDKEYRFGMYLDRELRGDTTFIVGGKKIKADQYVLVHSPKYKAQFQPSGIWQKNLDPVEVKDVSASAFEEYLQFFYFGQAPLTRKNIEDVLMLTQSSLVESFFDACISFLDETLSVDNVCQTYHLAMKYEKEDLIEHCERHISLHSEKVFSLKEFLDCSPADLFNILQSDKFSCKEIVIFDACILWAKKRCIESNLDPESMDDLRRILTDSCLSGSLLHQIRFGTMSYVEFMNCYKKFKGLFTESEREEVQFVIAKVNDSEPTLFNAEPRYAPYWKWDEENSVQCNRIQCTLETDDFLPAYGMKRTTFSCDKRIWLGGFHLRSLANEDQVQRAIETERRWLRWRVETGCPPAEDELPPEQMYPQTKCVPANISIVQKLNCLDVGTILYSITESVTLTTQETFVKLWHPIMLLPNFIYEIRTSIYDLLLYKEYEFETAVVVEDKLDPEKRATIKYSDFRKTPKDLVTRLHLNFCK